MRLPPLIICLCLLVPGTAPAVITFDDLSPGLDWMPIQNGYAGLQWSNFGVLNGSLRPANEGYHAGTISLPNVAFNLFGNPASLSSSIPFDLHSAYLTSALNLDTTLHIRVQGFRGTTLAYDNVYDVTRFTPTLVDFDYLGINQATFITSPPTQFSIDNLVLVPEPNPCLLGLIGAALAVWANRHSVRG